MENFLKQYLNELNINLNYRQIMSLLQYWDFLLDKNLYINFISRKGSDKERIVLHIIDSLTPLLRSWPNKINMLDFGSGGGLPGIPLKIAFPQWNVTLLEATTKKADFLNSAIKLLKLQNIKVLNLYFNPVNNLNNLYYDLIVVRAVSDLTKLIPFISPILKQGASFLAFKGLKAFEELDNATALINKFNFELVEDIKFILPYVNASRHLLHFKKVK